MRENSKKHSCSYDLEEWMDFDAVNVEVINTVMNDCINKILADTTESEEWIQHFISEISQRILKIFLICYLLLEKSVL